MLEMSKRMAMVGLGQYVVSWVEMFFRFDALCSDFGWLYQTIIGFGVFYSVPFTEQIVNYKGQSTM